MISQGFIIGFVGIIVVFLVLSLLILSVNLTSRLVRAFGLDLPEISSAKPVQSSDNQTIKAVISAAVNKYRKRNEL